MAKTTDTVAKRFAALLSSGIGARLSAQVKAQEKKLGPDANIVLPEWADPSTAVLTLNSSSILDQAAITAFQKADLDPKDSIHWWALLMLFSWAHFGKWPGPGRPTKWTSKKYEVLLRDFYKVRNENPTISASRVCKFLKARHPTKYDGTSAGRLAKEVKKAQDPKFNPSLAHLLETMMKAARADYQRQNLSWSPDVEVQERRKYLELILELSGPKKKLHADAASVRPQSKTS
jgi:hypothetical protein